VLWSAHPAAMCAKHVQLAQVGDAASLRVSAGAKPRSSITCYAVHRLLAVVCHYQCIPTPLPRACLTSSAWQLQTYVCCVLQAAD
jgi:hypothetical protein